MVMEQVLKKVFGSYGYEQDLFELAVLKKITDDDYDLCYSTPITNNVLGWLTNEEVLVTLEKIKNLPPPGIVFHNYEDEEDDDDWEDEDDEVYRFELFHQIMRKAISKRQEEIDKRNEEIEEKYDNALHFMKTQHDLLKEIGQDFLDISELINNYIDYASDPVKLCMDNNMKESLDKMANEIQMRVMVACSKMNAFTNLGEVGDK